MVVDPAQPPRYVHRLWVGGGKVVNISHGYSNKRLEGAVNIIVVRFGPRRMETRTFLCIREQCARWLGWGWAGLGSGVVWCGVVWCGVVWCGVVGWVCVGTRVELELLVLSVLRSTVL